MSSLLKNIFDFFYYSKRTLPHDKCNRSATKWLLCALPVKLPECQGVHVEDPIEVADLLLEGAGWDQGEAGADVTILTSSTLDPGQPNSKVFIRPTSPSTRHWPLQLESVAVLFVKENLFESPIACARKNVKGAGAEKEFQALLLGI